MDYLSLIKLGDDLDDLDNLIQELWAFRKLFDHFQVSWRLDYRSNVLELEAFFQEVLMGFHYVVRQGSDLHVVSLELLSKPELLFHHTFSLVMSFADEINELDSVGFDAVEDLLLIPFLKD